MHTPAELQLQHCHLLKLLADGSFPLQVQQLSPVLLPSLCRCVWLKGECTYCRLKASLERLQRLTQSFTDALLAAFPARASALGKALGIQEERIQVGTKHALKTENHHAFE